MSEEHPNAALTRRVFAAFGRDAKQISAALDRDIVWRVPGNTIMSGEYRGTREVVEFLRRTGTETNGTYRSRLHTVLADEFYVFPNGAVTGVLLLAQSHLSIHTWPELLLANTAEERDPRRRGCAQACRKRAVADHPELRTRKPVRDHAKRVDGVLGSLHRHQSREEDDRRIRFLRNVRDGMRRRPLGDHGDAPPAVMLPQRFRAARRDRHGRNISIRAQPPGLEQIPAEEGNGKRRLVGPDLPGELMDESDDGRVFDPARSQERARVDLVDDDVVASRPLLAPEAPR